jgi:hypothetical protein
MLTLAWTPLTRVSRRGSRTVREWLGFATRHVQSAANRFQARQLRAIILDMDLQKRHCSSGCTEQLRFSDSKLLASTHNHGFCILDLLRGKLQRLDTLLQRREIEIAKACMWVKLGVEVEKFAK